MPFPFDYAGSDPVFTVDGVEETASQWQERTAHLAAHLRDAAVSRLALLNPSGNRLAAALLACQSVECEVLLLRGTLPDDVLRKELAADAALSGSDDAPRALCAGGGRRGFSILLATSGTTGVPKIARHELATLLGRIRPAQGNLERARWLLTYHPASFAGLQILLTALSTGGQLLTLSHTTVPDLAQTALTHRPTHVSGTPTFWRAFLMTLGPRAAELPLEQITLGGEIVDQGVLDRLRTLFPQAGIRHIYASTEAGSLFSVKDARAGFPARWLEEGIDGVQLRIRESALEVLSPRAMKGYASLGALSPFHDDGWLKTGDLVQLEGDRVYFKGRTDQVISVGGAKLTPEEVEAVLLAIPGVQEARVSALKNPLTGFIVGADIVPEPGCDPNQLKATILREASARLENHKVPRRIRIVDQISLSQSGKKERLG